MNYLKLLSILLFISFLSACAPTYTVSLQDGQDVIGLYSDHIDAGCLLEDNKGNNYIMDVASSDINNDETGNYTITYSYTIDSETYTCKRTVIVIDNIAPTVSLNPGIDTIKVNTTFIDAGVTANDETSDVTIEINSTVDITIIGTYEINYTVSDEAGNTSFIKRIVTVTE